MINNSNENTRTMIYNWTLKQNTVTNQEIAEFIQNSDKKYVYIKYINPLLKSGKLDRVRRGLYTAIDPIAEQPVADPIIVSSKLRTPYYLGYYTALTIYGSAYSFRNQANICIHPENRFREFTYNNITYTPCYTGDTETNIQTIRHRGHQVRVCGKERLLIEIVENPQQLGGWEQSLKSLETLGGIQYDKIPKILEKKDTQILTRKTGYILELLKEHNIYHRDIPEQVIQEIQGMIMGQPEYIEKNRKGHLNTKWMLYIHPEFENYLRGI